MLLKYLRFMHIFKFSEMQELIISKIEKAEANV